MGELPQRCTGVGISFTDRRVEALTQLTDRGVGDQRDELVATAHALVEGRRAHTDPLRHGLHREPAEPGGLEDVAPGRHDGRQGRAPR